MVLPHLPSIVVLHRVDMQLRNMAAVGVMAPIGMMGRRAMELAVIKDQNTALEAMAVLDELIATTPQQQKTTATHYLEEPKTDMLRGLFRHQLTDGLVAATLLNQALLVKAVDMVHMVKRGN